MAQSQTSALQMTAEDHLTIMSSNQVVYNKTTLFILQMTFILLLSACVQTDLMMGILQAEKLILKDRRVTTLFKKTIKSDTDSAMWKNLF